MLIARFVIVLMLAIAFPFATAARENTTAVWSDGHTSSLADEELMKYAVWSPGPGYPEEAQQSKIVGSGLYELRINKTGKTTEVAIVKSSGSRVLDQAARSAFMNWRFKPGIFVRIRMPVTWAARRIN